MSDNALMLAFLGLMLPIAAFVAWADLKAGRPSTGEPHERP